MSAPPSRGDELSASPGFRKLRHIRLVTSIVTPLVAAFWVFSAVMTFLTETVGWAVASAVVMVVVGGPAFIADMIGTRAAMRELDRWTSHTT